MLSKAPCIEENLLFGTRTKLDAQLSLPPVEVHTSSRTYWLCAQWPVALAGTKPIYKYIPLQVMRGRVYTSSQFIKLSFFQGDQVSGFMVLWSTLPKLIIKQEKTIFFNYFALIST